MILEELKEPTTDTEAEELTNIILTASKLLGRYHAQKEVEFQAKVSKMPTFGERLRALREHNRLTKSELARRCNISVDSIERYESNKNMPRYIQTLCAFAYWFRVKVDVLLGRDTERLKNE